MYLYITISGTAVNSLKSKPIPDLPILLHKVGYPEVSSAIVIASGYISCISLLASIK